MRFSAFFTFLSLLAVVAAFPGGDLWARVTGLRKVPSHSNDHRNGSHPVNGTHGPSLPFNGTHGGPPPNGTHHGGKMILPVISRSKAANHTVTCPNPKADVKKAYCSIQSSLKKIEADIKTYCANTKSAIGKRICDLVKAQKTNAEKTSAQWRSKNGYTGSAANCTVIC